MGDIIHMITNKLTNGNMTIQKVNKEAVISSPYSYTFTINYPRAEVLKIWDSHDT